MRETLWSLLILFGLVGCHPSQEEGMPSATPFLNVDTAPVDSILSRMSMEEKVGQLIVAYSDRPDSLQQQRLAYWTIRGRIGGVLLEDWLFDDFAQVIDSARRRAPHPLFVGTRQRGLLNNQFLDAAAMPAAMTLDALAKGPQKDQLRSYALQQLRETGVNFWLGAPEHGDLAAHPGFFEWLDLLRAEKVLRFVAPAWKAFAGPRDTLLLAPTEQQALDRLIAGGVSGLAVDSSFVARRWPSFLPDLFWTRYLDRKAGFQGLSLTQLSDAGDWERAWQGGIDLFIVPAAEAPTLHRRICRAVKADRQNRYRLDARVRKALLAKRWMRQRPLREPPVDRRLSRQVLQASVADWRGPVQAELPVTRAVLARHLRSDAWKVLRRRLYREAITVASNTHRLVPFRELNGSFRLLEYSAQPFSEFHRFFRKYAAGHRHYYVPGKEGVLPSPRSVLGNQDIGIMLLDEYRLDGRRDSLLIRDMRELGRQGRLVLLNFREPANLVHFDSTLTVIQLYERHDLNEQLAAQLLFGAVSANGRLPINVNAFFRAGMGERIDQIRLQFAPPETVGIAPEKLVGIDAIALTAIDEGATPGCQVAVAKEGKIIYSKGFGYHSYRKQHPVKTDDLYDVASITKVAATTLAAMKLYEAGSFALNDRLEKHLLCDRGSTLKNISIWKILTHQSGLQPNMPIAPYLMDRRPDNADCEGFFCLEARGPYRVRIADDFYFDRRYVDSIWRDVHRLPVKPQRGYRYSDVNFMLLQRMIEEKTGTALDELVAATFYEPLGLRQTAFNPVDRFERVRIVPTQYDRRWRHQLLRGYVHDETAALMGGVGGNAGLFSSAEDLAVIFQMLLNGGQYGGRQYLRPETIDLFTTAAYGNHRGLGFDKPYRTNRTSRAATASPASYGHTGFTGAAVWVDPTEELVFVFLSNRVHPRVRNGLLFRRNVRSRIHQVIYDALGSFDGQIPGLEERKKLKNGGTEERTN